MSNDSYTEVTNVSWFSRIKNSVGGMLVGILLFLVAFPVLFLNEGRAVNRAKTLKEGAKNVISVASDKIDDANENKLVHISATAKSDTTLADKKFGIEVANGLQLKRTVEMYQWYEEDSSYTKKKVGGGEQKVTKKIYKQKWSKNLISSDDFKDPKGHRNPKKFALKSRESKAEKVTAGAFTLKEELFSQINDERAVDVTVTPELNTQRSISLVGGKVYIGNDPSNERVGDLRISFTAVYPQEVSIVAKQRSGLLEAFPMKKGSIALVSEGNVSADEMFAQAEAANKFMTWALRIGGFILMLIGLNLLFKPLSVVADVLPIAGDIVGAGSFLIALLLTVPLSFVTIAIAWIVYRPLLGILLLLVSGGAGYLVITKLKTAKAEKAPAEPQMATASSAPKDAPDFDLN